MKEYELNTPIQQHVLVVIPTFNEAGNIDMLLDRLFGLNIPTLHVLIVDDNSPDGTAGLVARRSRHEPRLHLLHREKKMGLGTAYVAGFKFALQNGFDLIFEMDADLSHNPDDIPRFLSKTGEFDLVIGSRYLTGVNVTNWPLSRLLLSLFANAYTRIITRMPILDCTSGFKCFHRRVLEAITLDHIVSNGYAFQIELHYKAWRKGFRICEIPIVFTERLAGKSKMSRQIQLEAAKMVWRLKLHDLLGKLNH
ncbi:MAG: Undecaprenyl-phosphate mannosyltransferase [bacterium]|nr:Undecaprenyl-phosphate mannosyltransferase [bacterium]MCK6561491.1 polyprenol monophosphomannose synthase [bacterium]NUM65083.1 polyprenol monophosphomannose synthase [candidate division KSB1 bacterium]